MRTSRKYTRELKKQFGYFATWLPGTPLELGDIGVLKGNIFTKISNLSDFKIKFDVEKDTSKADIEHSSKGAVSITTKASGTVAPQGSSLGEIEAGIRVEFNKENAILFKANATLSPSIKDQVSVGNQVIKLFEEGKWDKNWVVITEIVEAESATILISSSSNSKIELKAKGDVGSANLDIADADLGFELKFSKDLSTKIIAEESLTPLFRASKIKRPWFSKPVFQTNRIKSFELESNELGAIDLITPNMVKKDSMKLTFDQVEFEDFDEV